MKKMIIAITMGDPSGIGPEIAVKVLNKSYIYEICHPLVFGDSRIITRALEMCKIPLQVQSYKSLEDIKKYSQYGIIDILDFQNAEPSLCPPGEIRAESGKAAVEYFISAIDYALQKKIDAIVTCPISKEAINRGGYRYPGHTEILAEKTKTENYGMFLVSNNLKVMHLSTHVSLKEVCNLVKKERVKKYLMLSYKACKDMGIENPRIAVAGLNPHAGEAGFIGREELEEIIPAMKELEKEGMTFTGPLSPDTVFYRAIKGEFDIVLAMYHDQGHIALKLMGFEHGVNVTVGTPVIRTSVDHGTAFDIAKKGIASSQSLEEAIKLAVRMAKSRHRQEAGKG